jgi:hypothetical protein
MENAITISFVIKPSCHRWFSHQANVGLERAPVKAYIPIGVLCGMPLPARAWQALPAGAANMTRNARRSRPYEEVMVIGTNQKA